MKEIELIYIYIYENLIKKNIGMNLQTLFYEIVVYIVRTIILIYNNIYLYIGKYTNVIH